MNTKFNIVQHKGNENLLAIRIEDGQFAGVVFKFGNIQFPDLDNANLDSLEFVTCKYVKEVFYCPPNLDLETQDFSNTLSDILEQLLISHFSEELSNEDGISEEIK